MAGLFYVAKKDSPYFVIQLRRSAEPSEPQEV